MSKEIFRLQLEAEQAWVSYWQAMVVSGAYKARQSERINEDRSDGCGGIVWRPSTNEEKLQDAMGSLHAHVERVQDFVNLLIEEED